MGLRKSHIALAVCAALAAAVLFVTYGTVLPAAPFASIQLDGPSVVDSDGEMTGVVDTESRRALILNADGDLTGVVGCTTTDSPVDAITDICVRDGLVYLAGVRYAPDSDVITAERLVAYDKGGNFQGFVYEMENGTPNPQIKAVHSTSKGLAIAYEKSSDASSASAPSSLLFGIVDERGFNKAGEVQTGDVATFDAAIGTDGDAFRCTALSVRGVLDDGGDDFAPQVYAGHVFTNIDLGGNGVLYACDDETGSLCSIAKGSEEVKVLVEGAGYHCVHENGGVISLCNSDTNLVKLCDDSGAVKQELAEVKPSVGFSARMMVVWASGLYLVGLALVLAVRKVIRMAREGKTAGIGPMLAAVAVVAAIAVAVGSISYASYQKMFDLRASEIKMSAEHLDHLAPSMSAAMEGVPDRNALRKSGDELSAAVVNMFEAAAPALSLVQAAEDNGIGMYCLLYGKDGEGIFYLYGTTTDYVMGTSAREVADKGLQEAFDSASSPGGDLRWGRTLHDATQYRLVRIPTSDGKGVAGVIEIGSKMRSFESSVTGDLAQWILGLLVMVLVVYLAYSELRACGRCLFSYRQRQQQDGARAIAVLTRPFTLAITMLTSIDSVMTVLIARDLLSKAGMGESSPLLAVPAVMLGIGLIVGQALYGACGRRVGLRRLMAVGAFVMLVCACATGAAVYSGVFWLYCAAKFAMAVPFGMLYVMGYSLQRLAVDDETRALAAGGVKRTDTSAAALGTVLGGYVAQTLGNVWVYALVAVACLPVILMALNLLPKGVDPLEKLAQPDSRRGRVFDFMKKRRTLALAFFVVLPATVAAGYASFLFPLFSSDLGLSKSDVNNIVVLGQLVVYLLIGSIERLETRRGRWQVSACAVGLLGVVFLLFAINTTLAWSVAVIAIVAVLCKATDGWKAMWLKTAGEEGAPAGGATSAMFATRSLALIAQPFILSALLGATDSVAVIVIGVICAVCALAFFFATRHTLLAGNG